MIQINAAAFNTNLNSLCNACNSEKLSIKSLSRKNKNSKNGLCTKARNSRFLFLKSNMLTRELQLLLVEQCYDF